MSAELEALQFENRALKADLAASKTDLSYEQEKFKSLEETLSSLESSQGEKIENERRLAQERAEVQREKDEAHARQISEMEIVASNDKADFKIALERVNFDWSNQVRELNEKLDALKIAKDTEIKSLTRELADRKADFAQEISSALLLAENNKKLADESIRKAELAEEVQKSLQGELKEAKIIQQFNIQLHKDLQREQNARKKLHNEMEDLKGKIRVYVRIRPFSKSENERGCNEAVVKDGKLSVVVFGVGAPDAKKVFDFDQVFGGKGEGNSQTDIFKDSKHLIMSVVDGFNVCMFAYGMLLIFNTTAPVIKTSKHFIHVCRSNRSGQELHNDWRSRYRRLCSPKRRLPRVGRHNSTGCCRALPTSQRTIIADNIHR